MNLVIDHPASLLRSTTPRSNVEAPVFEPQLWLRELWSSLSLLMNLIHEEGRLNRMNGKTRRLFRNRRTILVAASQTCNMQVCGQFDLTFP